MFRHYTSSDISFAIGKFENVVGIFEGPEHRQVPHYKTKLGPSAWNAARSKELAINSAQITCNTLDAVLHY